MITNIKRKDFQTEVLLSDRLVVADFYAPWCGPCKELAPVLEELADKYADKIKVVKVNVDEEESIAVRFGVANIPTVIFFKDGKTVASFVGFRSLAETEKIVEKHL